VKAQLVREWIERRRRIEEELEFHRDLLEQQFIALGHDASAARKLARRRLGVRSRYQRQGRDQLRARFLDLIQVLIAHQPGHPWISTSLVAVASLFLGFLLPRDTGMAVPVAIWLSVLICILPVEASRALHYRSHWRYYFYSIVSLMSAGLAASAVWDCMLLIWRLPKWPSQGWSVFIFVVELIAYSLGCWLTLQLWSRNRICRCRSCARKLRLPDEQGRLGSLLLNTVTHSSICIYGHGALTVSYWQHSWHGNGGFWDEIVKPSHS